MRSLSKSILATICILLLYLSFANAANVSVIMDKDNEIFIEVFSGFQNYLSSVNIKPEYSKYFIDKEKPEAIVNKIRSSGNDVIFAIGRYSLTLAAKEFSSKTPVVYTLVVDYEPNISQKVAGVAFYIPNDNKIGIIKETLPDTAKIGFIYSTNYTPMAVGLKQSIEKHGMKYIENVIDSDKGFSIALNNVLPNIDCFLIVPDDKIYYSSTIKLLLFEGIKNNVPIIGLNKSFTQMGATLSIECDYEDLGGQVGRIFERIHKGESPNTIGIEFPRKFSTSLNLLSAQKCGKNVSREAVNKANKIFQ